MDEESGNRNAKQPVNFKLSLNSTYPGKWAESAEKLVGSSEMTIDDQISMHLVDCAQCREAAIKQRPVGLGQKSGHCDAYWQLQLMRAQFEGQVNNIVAHTEYGDEAQRRGNLG